MDSCRRRYKTEEDFIKCFRPEMTAAFLKSPGGKETMVTAENVPSITIAKLTFGETCVKTILMAHLFELKRVFGVEASGEQIENIAEDIMYECGYLKITEIMLFFKMLRGGEFRSGENNRGKMYGSLSGEVITDCLYQFRNEYRQRVLDDHQRRLDRERLEEAEKNQASYEDRFEIFADKCLADPSFLDFIRANRWLKEEDIKRIEIMTEEFKAYKLLRRRVTEFVDSINRGCDPKSGIKVLDKAVRYLDEKFPNDKTTDNETRQQPSTDGKADGAGTA